MLCTSSQGFRRASSSPNRGCKNTIFRRPAFDHHSGRNPKSVRSAALCPSRGAELLAVMVPRRYGRDARTADGRMVCSAAAPGSDRGRACEGMRQAWQVGNTVIKLKRERQAALGQQESARVTSPFAVCWCFAARLSAPPVVAQARDAVCRLPQAAGPDVVGGCHRRRGKARATLRLEKQQREAPPSRHRRWAGVPTDPPLCSGHPAARGTRQALAQPQAGMFVQVTCVDRRGMRHGCGRPCTFSASSLPRKPAVTKRSMSVSCALPRCRVSLGEHSRFSAFGSLPSKLDLRAQLHFLDRLPLCIPTQRRTWQCHRHGKAPAPRRTAWMKAMSQQTLTPDSLRGRMRKHRFPFSSPSTTRPPPPQSSRAFDHSLA